LKTRRFFIISLILLFAACTSTKNTGGTRWYHSFNTRFNVYFNGNEAFNQAWKAQLEGYNENYSEMILMYPVSSLPKDKSATGGAFDKSIEKAVKAIKMHSIQTKPERKQGKQRDPKYREFMSRKEYNPFLHNAWMLMAKSQFYNGDFLEAASSFSYISRLYESQPEIAIPAKLWKARCYSEMSWFYDAEDILSKLKKTQLSNSQIDMLSSVYADLLVKQKQYAEAIPYMQIAIKAEKNKRQRTREKYLLGQLYTVTGQKDLAYKTFGEVSSSNAPYVLELSARIRQTEVYPGSDANKMSKRLISMTKSVKNKDYLDQIYYALGNVYMMIPDTAKAVESYESGVEKSASGGIDKALNQVKLGDIYFNRRKYLQAQPNYSEALGQLKKDDDAYPRVSKRSEALDALVVHFEAVELQDSLQRLSRMTEEERLAVVNKIIADLIKKEKEEAEKAKREENLANQQDLQGQMQPNRPVAPSAGAIPPGESDAFYFYNSQAVTIGKNSFQQKWGRRKLEDDWRRKNKSNPLSDMSEEEAAVDSVNNAAGTNDTIPKTGADSGAADQASNGIKASTDPKDPQFYLQQIPVTDEEIIASNQIISDGLFNMGIIYKDMLGDNHLALETFNELNTRFPYNENKQMAYYYMYLIYWQEDNMDMANLYKAKIRAEFPESELAIAMADPDYEYNQKRMNIIQDSLYQQTYADYLAGNSMNIRTNCEWFSTKYNQSKLMPKFMFLNALSYAQTNDPDTFKKLLKELITKYPQEDVTTLASEMMKGFQRGLILSGSGDNMLARGSLFNVHFGAEGEEAVSDSTLQFSIQTATPHELLLIYPKESLNENLLLYTVAGFNFGNFTISDFDLEKTAIGNIGILRIKGFKSQEEVMRYLDRIKQPGGYAKDLGQTVIMSPISEENYSILMKGKSLDDYMNFFEKNFSKGNENLIAQWRLKQVEEKQVMPNGEEENNLPENGEKPVEEIQPSQTDLQAEAAQITQPADTVQTIASDSLSTKTNEDASEKLVDSANEIYNAASDKLNEAQNTLNNISSDPIRWFLGLFKRDKLKNNYIEEYAKQQEKEEKDRQMQLKKEQDAKDKAAKADAMQAEKEKQETLKKQTEDSNAALKAKQKEQSDLTKQKETERKQKEAEKKRLAKEKKDALDKARQQKEKERKDKEKTRKEEQKKKEKEREALRKAKEKERKARLEQQKKGKKK